MRTHSGFTLSELLIALVILGLIATFTIPKVLSSQQGSQYKAVAKETISAISEAYQQYKLSGSLSTSTTAWDIRQYLNYVKVESNGFLMDDEQGFGSSTCGNNECILLHNGAVLKTTTSFSFNNTSSTNAVPFWLDPVEGYSGTTTKGKQLFIYLTYDGRITTKGKSPATGFYHSGGGPFTGSTDASWFDWN